MKFGGLTRDIGGIAIAVIVEPTLDQLLDKFLPMQSVGGIGVDDLIKAFILPMVIKKRKGIVGSAISTIRILALANIVRGFVGGGFNLLSVPTSTTVTATTW